MVGKCSERSAFLTRIRRAGLSVLWFAASWPASALAQAVGAPSISETSFTLPSGDEMTYAISVPDGYDGSPADRRPLVLALHPGGGGGPYYGSWFMQALVEPALRDWGAVIVAPDVPGRSWASSESERAALALLDDVASRYAIDPERVLVTGFSMGGAGVWYLATRNPDRFTGAIAIAGRPRDEDLDALASLPLYLIHSPDDEVVPYEPVEEAALMLAERGYAVQLLSVAGFSHYTTTAYVGPLRAGGEWMMEQWQMGAATAP
jgi:predicted peptidase